MYQFQVKNILKTRLNVLVAAFNIFAHFFLDLKKNTHIVHNIKISLTIKSNYHKQGI